MMAFDGPKNLAVQDEKIINEKTGIPIKICSEIIKVSKEIIK
jgi:hypothetical protein